LREWWFNAVQTFEDTVGSDVAIKYIRPHVTNSGKASALIFASLTGIADPIIQLEAAGRSMEKFTEGSWEVSAISSDGSFINRYRNCVTGGDCRTLCITFCDYCVCSRWNEAEPSWNVRLIKSQNYGDSYCEWLVVRKNKKISDARIEEYRDFYVKGLPSPLSPEMDNAINHEYIGEFWVMATRAFIEHSGGQKALERLTFSMRHSGMSLGIRLAEHFDYHEMGAEVIGDIVALVSDLHRRKCTITTGEETIEGDVTECPFVHSALPEMCQQYCAFFNGVCEVIDPSYEFVYDRMMTKGDSTCHWVIRKKASMVEGTKTVAESEVLKRLASRYVMGEISKQEYEELKAILR
jgi:predicted hydrocarbon binding protein